MTKPKLYSKTSKPHVLPPVRPNVGLELQYRRRLDALVTEMHRSIVFWLTRTYRSNPPHLARDASPAADLQAEMNRLARRWNRRFATAAKKIAAFFTRSVSQRSDAAMKGVLKKAGFTVQFKMSQPVQDIFTATLNAQVGLIKSIASEHLTDVQEIVMRSVQQGGDLQLLTDELEKRYSLTRERARLIAKDQNSKATATITRVRQQQIGITQAIWLHSRATGKHARPEHVAFAAGKHEGPTGPGPVYDVSKGAFLEGKLTFPGWEINCRCVSRSILPALKAESV